MGRILNSAQSRSILWVSTSWKTTLLLQAIQICKLAGLDAVLEAWVKHHVDFFKTKRIIFTRSAIPSIQMDQESGVGYWYNIRISTFSRGFPQLGCLFSLWRKRIVYKTSLLGRACNALPKTRRNSPQLDRTLREFEKIMHQFLLLFLHRLIRRHGKLFYLLRPCDFGAMLEV